MSAASAIAEIAADPSPGRAGAGALLEPRRRLTLERARARSQFLVVWRGVCLGVAAACLGLIVGAVALHSVGGLQAERNELGGREALTIRSPRFNGRDTGGGAYIVTADTATRQAQNADKIDLVEPRYAADNGNAVSARRGVYDSQSRHLELYENVVFTDAAARVFVSAYAFVDATRDLVRGDTPIAGSGPLGDIRADAYELHGDRGRIVMRGNVKGTLQSSVQPEEPGP